MYLVGSSTHIVCYNKCFAGWFVIHRNTDNVFEQSMKKIVLVLSWDPELNSVLTATQNFVKIRLVDT